MKIKQAWLAGLAGLILSGCGGGGGGSLPYASFSIAGLEPTKSVTLALTHLEGSVISVTANGPSAVSAGLAGGTYTVKVSRHPQRQLCQVVNGSSLNVAKTNVSVSVECHYTHMNDTGEEKDESSYSSTDSYFGRDAAAYRGEDLNKVGAGRAGFDFTKMCADGKPATIDSVGNAKCTERLTTNEWACIRDNTVSLMWDRRIFGLDEQRDSGTLCGTGNWRRANVHDLISIIDNSNSYDANDPKVDKSYFDKIAAGMYRSKDISVENQKPWFVHFTLFGVAGTGVSCDQNNCYEMWVSELADYRLGDSQKFQVSNYSDQYVILDDERDLIWLFEKTPPEAGRTWKESLDYTNSLNREKIGGFSDWRLPNKNELDSLVDRTATTPPMMSAEMLRMLDNPLMYARAFWSSTKRPDDNADSATVFRVDFVSGDITLQSERERGGAVYVRNRVTTP